MNYEAYIASQAWKNKRQQVLDRDKCQCQTCLSTEDLEVHHKTYAHLGDEPLDDLITLCHECHEAITTVIRRRRYEAKAITVESIERVTPIVIERGLVNAEIEISTHIRVSSYPSQRTDGRSFEQIFKGDKENQQQARQDGRRF